MRIALVGKGGSGKTTLASLFIRHLHHHGIPVLAIDADINQHLASALGTSEQELATIPALGEHLAAIKAHLAGTNPRISDPTQMIKTTPPGAGSRLLTHDDPYFSSIAYTHDGIRIMATGGFDKEDIGVKCYHAKTGAVELILNHLLDHNDEYVVVDMTAGADSFASGLFTKFDLTCIVVEPTQKSLSVYEQYRHYAKDYGITLRVIGNKITDENDLAFLKDHLGDALLTTIPISPYVRAGEKGVMQDFTSLETPTREALETLTTYTRTIPIDRETMHTRAIAFHIDNAQSWGNASMGHDLTTQVDPTFTWPS